MMHSTPARQNGMTLLVALIMLVLMTLFAVTSFNLGKSSMKIVGNMQQRSQATVSAQSAIDETISNTYFVTNPSSVFAVPCTNPNTRCYDINADGIQDITVTLAPAPFCNSAKTIKSATLNLSNPDDLGCSIGVSQSFGIAGSVSGDSLCANSMWELNAVATDNVTLAQATVTQGVAVRVSVDSVAATCP
jgi:Tfp pilus assembly protein PilX